MNGKEHEVKLTWESVKYLNKVVEGGSLAVVGQALQGDLDLLPHVIHAGLKHTGENYKFADVEKAIELAVTEERLDFLEILRISNEVVSESFFYAPMVTKMLAKTKGAKEQIDSLLK